jgi:hypothetical protein
MSAEPLSDETYYGELVQLLRPGYHFTHLGYHFGADAGPTSRTTRVMRDGKHLVKKEYLGELTEKTEQEIGLLMAATRKGLRHTASLKSVHAETSNLKESAAPRLELLMRNYGLDLEDWSFLLRMGKFEFWGSPYFHLALWSRVLSAMHELHQANFVQVDVKSENICVALPNFLDAAFDASNRITLRLDLKTLTLIDLGEALHPDPNKRVLLFHANGMVLGPGNKYISPHFIKRKALVRPNDMKPLRSLDWRIDFFALGCTVDDWNRSTHFAAVPPAYLSQEEKRNYADAINILHQLPTWLKSEDTDPATEANDLPHQALISKIGKVLQLEKWEALEFTLPRYIGATNVSISRSGNKPTRTEERRDATADLPLAQRTARETQLDNAPNLRRRKADRGNAYGLFERRAPYQPAPRVSKKDVDAVNWYRRIAVQEDAPGHDIDLLC